MALSSVVRRAVNVVRAYSQREWNDQVINVAEIPPAAIPVMRSVYGLLGFVFLILAFFSTNSRSLFVALWKVSTGFYCFWATMFWERTFSFFYIFSVMVVIVAILESTASFVSDYSPSFTFEEHTRNALFVMYVTAYSQLMARRIVETRENDYVVHAVYLFVDFPYVCYHFIRTKVEAIRRRIGSRVPDHQQ